MSVALQVGMIYQLTKSKTVLIHQPRTDGKKPPIHPDVKHSRDPIRTTMITLFNYITELLYQPYHMRSNYYML